MSSDLYENTEFDYTSKITAVTKKVNSQIPSYSGGLFCVSNH